jgi:hypothetical protein
MTVLGNFKTIIKLLVEVTKVSGKQTIWDLNSIDYSRILSTKHSTMQQVHFDFAGSPNQWKKFEELEAELHLTPLSMLHFPEG